MFYFQRLVPIDQLVRILKEKNHNNSTFAFSVNLLNLHFKFRLELLVQFFTTQLNLTFDFFRGENRTLSISNKVDIID